MIQYDRNSMQEQYKEELLTVICGIAQISRVMALSCSPKGVSENMWVKQVFNVAIFSWSISDRRLEGSIKMIDLNEFNKNNTNT